MAFRQRRDDGAMTDADTPRPGWLGPWLKGFPALQPPLPLADVAQRGWTIASLPTPLAVVRQAALAHNIEWMQRFAAERGVHLAPHGKTTMSPQLFRRQLDAGAWGLTFANVHQLRLGLGAGARRALIANQLVSAADLAELLDLRRRHPGVELAFFVDSQAQLDLLAAHWAQLGAGEARVDVLIELGTSRCGLRKHAPALALARALKDHPALRLRGIGFYEGLQVLGETEPDRALMQQWQARVEALLAGIEAEGLIDVRPLWLSGGGSALFDLVAPVLAGRPGRIGLLRSGCYICHDHAHYGRYMRTMDERMGTPAGRPQPAASAGGVDAGAVLPRTGPGAVERGAARCVLRPGLAGAGLASARRRASGAQRLAGDGVERPACLSALGPGRVRRPCSG